MPRAEQLSPLPSTGRAPGADGAPCARARCGARSVGRPPRSAGWWPHVLDRAATRVRDASG